MIPTKDNNFNTKTRKTMLKRFHAATIKVNKNVAMRLFLLNKFLRLVIRKKIKKHLNMNVTKHVYGRLYSAMSFWPTFIGYKNT